MATDINDFDNVQLDVLREIGNIGSGNAATALAKMLNKKVNMNVPNIRMLEFKNISDVIGGADIEVVGILLEVTGDISGNIMFMLECNAARALVNMLMGIYFGEERAFTDMELSALGEIGNILSGAYLSALSTATGLKIMPSTPNIAIDMAGAILSVPAIEVGKYSDSVLYLETVFLEGDTRAVGDFLLVLNVESYDVLLKALGDID